MSAPRVPIFTDGETSMTDNIPIRYGDRTLMASFPAGCAVEVVGRRPSENPDEVGILCDALNDPLAALPVEHFLAEAHRPLVIVNDGTRSTPTAKLLAALLPSLSHSPKWQVIVATGLHRAPSDTEMHAIFGDTLDLVRSRVLVHNGYDDASLVSIPAAGGPVEVNRALADADRVIALNSVEPHFFAGYTGGRKSIIPGLAGRRTIERSHAGAVTLAAAPLRVHGNPVREFIHKNTAFWGPDRLWALQVVLDRENRIAAAFAGDIDKTFEMACHAARKYYAVELTQRYDIILSAVHPPLDINLYQAFKGWELSQIAVRDNGVLIFTAPCREGVGSPFYKTMCEMFPDQSQWPALADRPYTLGLHKFVRTARATSRYHLMAVTDMPAAEVRRYGFEAYANLDDAIRDAVAHVETPARALVVEDAAVTALDLDTSDASSS